ncbi:hypothetical protein FMN52_00930 [Marinobacter sp. BW6]|uniref:hypothetical protein n=1 Tax=Marinobacter sp. BW6 TaxID=2592624 RepID=UPI0011DE89DC|nr:hypothetical protein [Marinobacter sp. BW6]TYC63820.1 hypothetical protein FMN52_00930 [Marinobacter sp. BW6]
MKGLLLLVVLLTCSSSLEAIEPNQGNLSGLAEAYGFVMGQNLSLDRISREYPALAREALLAKLAFERTFGDIHDQLNPKFIEFMGEERFREYRAQLEGQLNEMNGQQKITRAIAESFLEDVRKRAEGEIYSPTLEYLLAIRFGDNPVQEYARGFRQRFHTDGSGKSLGVVMNLQLPQSWQEQEGNRPHIVRKWKSDAGTGMELIMLQVRGTEGVSITRADVAEMMQPGEIEGLVPYGGALQDYGMVSVEGLPGYFMDFDLLMERAGMAIYQKLRQYTFFYHDRMVAVQCSAGALERDHELVETQFGKIKPLCAQVFNSVVLPEKYLKPEPERHGGEDVVMPSI